MTLPTVLRGEGEDQTKAKALLKSVGLAGRELHLPTQLSGGEQQRLSIARGLLKDAPILLLDEVTSSMDPQNQYLIQQALNTLAKDKTVIIIAHQLSTVIHAEQILVMNKGKIVERGTHSTLIQNNKLYKKLWEAQGI